MCLGVSECATICVYVCVSVRDSACQCVCLSVCVFLSIAGLVFRNALLMIIL